MLVRLQLRDFAFDDWNMRQSETDSKKDTRQIKHVRPYIEPMRRLQQTVHNPKMILNLNLRVDEVISGEDRLGKARFQMHVR